MLSHENSPADRPKREKTIKDIPGKLLGILNIVYVHNSPQQMLIAYITVFLCYFTICEASYLFFPFNPIDLHPCNNPGKQTLLFPS